MATLVERLALPDMSGLTDWSAATVLNTPDPLLGFVRLDADPRDIYETLLTSGEWGRIELFSRLIPTGTLASPSPQDTGVARLVTFVRAVQFDRPLRTSRVAVAAVLLAILDALVTDNFIGSATRIAILDLGRRRQSWAEANGVLVDARAVGIARGGRA